MEQSRVRIGITTFGELTFIHECEVFRVDGYLTKNVRYLLELLIYYRMTPLSKNQIIDLLWSGSHNPESALKFTVHRLRQALKDIPLFEETSLIVTTKHGYDLNPEFDYDIDFEEVDNLWKQIQFPSKIEKDKKKQIMSLVSKINKPFLTSSSSLLWTIPIREYYTNIYNQTMIMLLKKTEAAKKYPDLIQYSQRAISFDRFNEDFHYYHILGLIHDRQIRQAIEAYEKTRELFFNELKVDLSEKTKELFKLLLSKDEMNFVKMGDLVLNLNDNSPLDGAFYCEYEVFKRIYQNQMRAQVRSRELVCLVILELRTEILDRVGSGEVDILLGTQMIAKGLDFPNVTLVGVIDADIGINLPDFRASERTFQLLSQVAGRAGRGPKGGEVFIQTRTPGHHAVVCAIEHDYLRFVGEELPSRESPPYPPTLRLANLVISGLDELAVAACAQQAADWLAPRIATLGDAVTLVGPSPCPIERIKGRWRWHLVLKAERSRPMTQLMRAFLTRFELPASHDMRVTFDRDPVALL